MGMLSHMPSHMPLLMLLLLLLFMPMLLNVLQYMRHHMLQRNTGWPGEHTVLVWPWGRHCSDFHDTGCYTVVTLFSHCRYTVVGLLLHCYIAVTRTTRLSCVSPHFQRSAQVLNLDLMRVPLRSILMNVVASTPLFSFSVCCLLCNAIGSLSLWWTATALHK
jgi:hypothetical protein